MALQDLASSLREERGGVFALLAPHHALAIMEVVATHSGTVAGQVTADRREDTPAPETAGFYLSGWETYL